MLVPSGGQYGCARAQSAASLTELSSGAGTAIVRDLERRGTPRGNYKISEADVPRGRGGQQRGAACPST